MRPKERFSKATRLRYKALRKCVGGITPPAGIIYVTGLTYGVDYPYVEVFQYPNTRLRAVYFIDHPTRHQLLNAIGYIGK